MKLSFEVEFCEQEYFPVFGRIPVVHAASATRDEEMRRIIEQCCVVRYPELNRYLCRWCGKVIAFAFAIDE